uniref:Uncharacterized protein n=1 Tax=Pristionchus pacificus TaxID=54126 RepID=A0A2A6BTS2_PRIPA|eukprot:PDM69329.1 hypothetical protein PRIPAC_47631 [Pristionchus pacificus]
MSQYTGSDLFALDRSIQPLQERPATIRHRALIHISIKRIIETDQTSGNAVGLVHVDNIIDAVQGVESALHSSSGIQLEVVVIAGALE